MSAKRKLALSASALFLIALLVRLPGIAWGLPNDIRNQSFHPDELVVYNFSKEIEPFRLNFTPKNYNYPTLFPTLLRFIGDAAVLYSGTPDPMAEGREITPAKWKQLSENQRTYHLAGRVISCVAGAALALVCFLFVAPRSVIGGWFAGLFSAFAPVLVLHSRWQTVDMLAAALFAASLLLASRLAETDSIREVPKLALWAATLAGLSAGTKYVGIVALAAIFAALIVRRPPNALKLALGCVGVAIGVFLLTTPGAVLNWERFSAGLDYEFRHAKEGLGLYEGDIIFAETPSGFAFQSKNLGLGSAPFAAAIGSAALLAAAALKRRWAIVLLAALIPLFVVIGMSDIKFSRYAVPLFVGLAVGFGAAAGALAARPRLAIAVPLVATFLLVGFEGPLTGLRGVWQITAWMRQEDPRDTAARNILARTSNAVDATVGLVRQPWYYSVPVFPDANYSFHIPREMTAAMLDATSHPHVVFPIRDQLPSFVVETDLETMHARRIEHMTRLSLTEQQTVTELRRIFALLDSRYAVDSTFGSGPEPHVDDLRYVQPRVKIYRLAE